MWLWLGQSILIEQMPTEVGGIRKEISMSGKVWFITGAVVN
jgi:hypothetical protein